MALSETQPPFHEPSISATELEPRIAAAGRELRDSFSALVKSIPNAPGPQVLARRLGIDKVLSSRLLKALRSSDPLSVLHRIPGPDPLRRFVKAAARHTDAPDLVRPAQDAVDGFERLIRDVFRDRSSLDAVLSAWVPEARREFELRRKQSAFRAMSQIKGTEAYTLLATTFLHPSADGTHVDVVWISGLIGLHRLRPGAPVKFATRRLDSSVDARHPQTLGDEPIEGIHSALIEGFCSTPLPELDVQRFDEVVHYRLTDGAFGPGSEVDLVFAEVNRGEIDRYVPRDSQRKGFVFAEVFTPSRILQFDAFVHEDVYPNSRPKLRIYDTALEGIASVNDPTRDIDLLDMRESIEHLGNGIDQCRSPHVPRYLELLRTACDRMGWDGSRFHAYRCHIDYPVYGSQVAMTFDPPPAPDGR